MDNVATTLCNRPFALESVSRRETAVQGQTAVTHVRWQQLKKNSHYLKLKLYERKNQILQITRILG